jgi:hypothetical protein
VLLRYDEVGFDEESSISLTCSPLKMNGINKTPSLDFSSADKINITNDK